MTVDHDSTVSDLVRLFANGRKIGLSIEDTRKEIEKILFRYETRPA